MKHLVFILLALVLIASCSRYDNDYVLSNFNLELLSPLKQALQNATADNISAVMGYYHADYLYSDLRKADREAMYQSVFEITGDKTFDLELIQAEQTTASQAKINWKLKVLSDPGTREETVILDITFTNEQVIKEGGMWKFYGNRQSQNGQEQNQKVLVESFTATWCTGCPFVEERLDELQQAHPGRIIVLENHYADALDFGSAESYAYYGQTTLPYSVFQGETKVSGSNDTALNQYNINSTYLMNQPARFAIEQKAQAISGQNVTATIRFTCLNPDVFPEQLTLRYSIIGSMDATVAGTTKTYHNVVLARGSAAMSADDLNTDIPISLSFAHLPGGLPEDASLVVYLQNYQPSFTNTSTVFNAIQHPIDQSSKQLAQKPDQPRR